MMFEDAETTTINLDSSWKSNQELKVDSITQTFSPRFDSSLNQSIEFENASVQTASIQTNSKFSLGSTDTQKLGSFLQKVENDISKSLLDNIKSTAFESTLN